MSTSLLSVNPLSAADPSGRVRVVYLKYSDEAGVAPEEVVEDMTVEQFNERKKNEVKELQQFNARVKEEIKKNGGTDVVKLTFDNPGEDILIQHDALFVDHDWLRVPYTSLNSYLLTGGPPSTADTVTLLRMLREGDGKMSMMPVLWMQETMRTMKFRADFVKSMVDTMEARAHNTEVDKMWRACVGVINYCVQVLRQLLFYLPVEAELVSEPKPATTPRKLRKKKNVRRF